MYNILEICIIYQKSTYTTQLKVPLGGLYHARFQILNMARIVDSREYASNFGGFISQQLP